MARGRNGSARRGSTRKATSRLRLMLTIPVRKPLPTQRPQPSRAVARFECPSCGKSYPSKYKYIFHKLLCDPDELFHCPEPGCNYHSGREDCTTLHLAAVHDVYLDNDPKVRSVNRAHLNKKQRSALQGALLRDSKRLGELKAEYAQWDAARRELGVPGEWNPRRQDMLAPTPTRGQIEGWKKAKLIAELIPVRQLLFGPNFGSMANWNAFSEVDAIARHVRAWCAQNGRQPPSVATNNTPGAEGDEEAEEAEEAETQDAEMEDVEREDVEMEDEEDEDDEDDDVDA